jgi:hypothetical protein
MQGELRSPLIGSESYFMMFRLKTLSRQSEILKLCRAPANTKTNLQPVSGELSRLGVDLAPNCLRAVQDISFHCGPLHVIDLTLSVTWQGPEV